MYPSGRILTQRFCSVGHPCVAGALFSVTGSFQCTLMQVQHTTLQIKNTSKKYFTRESASIVSRINGCLDGRVSAECSDVQWLCDDVKLDVKMIEMLLNDEKLEKCCASKTVDANAYKR
ncbi:hypothetical protein Tsp_01376 [Trichinella spiralis]|uniref:hypothetical protein n=1 Tax=Trichinella spiralis TaxID=6334 RepID=UPI0001EFB2C6|nr:hypothetical protein Tsp_01376 [Trichinella spiralis]